MEVIMLRSLIALTLLVGAVSTPALAKDPTPVTSGNGNSGTPAFCGAEILPTVPQANLGECVSYGTTSDEGFASHMCDALREIHPDVFYSLYDSFSECVRENKTQP
jgi:hypothetical protein